MHGEISSPPRPRCRSSPGAEAAGEVWAVAGLAVPQSPGTAPPPAAPLGGRGSGPGPGPLARRGQRQVSIGGTRRPGDNRRALGVKGKKKEKKKELR